MALEEARNGGTAEGIAMDEVEGSFRSGVDMLPLSVGRECRLHSAASCLLAVS